jgi:putative NIF3 family GTP cyclohydrolase 1 type 2
MTVQDFDDFLCDLDPEARSDNSPDGLKWGDPGMTVRAVGTTWMASMPVLRQAVTKDTNLIVTHEPTFWYHGTPLSRELSLCEQHGVDVSFKTSFLDQHGMAVIRAHNCWDRYPEYGIEASLRVVLGLPEPEARASDFHSLYRVTPTTLRALALHCRAAIGMPCVRFCGDPDKAVERIVLAYGASSGTGQYYRFWRKGVDAVISGEQCEWADIRPAIDMGLGVIELGHSNTEAYGMEGLARLLREHFPSMPIEHIPAGDSFGYV